MHLTATFDYTTGKMALYRNGEPLDGFYTTAGDPWQVDGTGTVEHAAARHQDRRLVPAEHARAQPLQLPVRQPDVPRHARSPPRR